MGLPKHCYNVTVYESQMSVPVDESVLYIATVILLRKLFIKLQKGVPLCLRAKFKLLKIAKGISSQHKSKLVVAAYLILHNYLIVLQRHELLNKKLFNELIRKTGRSKQ